MHTNSYDSGDWFNLIDWSGHATAWDKGLPQSSGNASAWPLITTIFADATAKPAAENIAFAEKHFEELLEIRKSSPLFRLRTDAEVKKRLDFQNGGLDQEPGVLVMTLADGTCAGADLDPQRDGIVVVVNATPSQKQMTVTGATGARLHAVQMASTDPVEKTASASGEVLTVPARTTAVFEIPQSEGRAGGPPCNTRTP